MKKIIYTLIGSLLLAGCGAPSPLEKDAVNNENAGDATLLVCNEGSTHYGITGTTVEFCYLPKWGEPKDEVIAKGSKGEAHLISFSDSAEKSPQILYFPSGFVADLPLEAASKSSLFLNFCFDCLNVAGDESTLIPQVYNELKKIVNQNIDENKVKTRKAAVHDIRAVRVHYEYPSVNELIYIIPTAFEGHHMAVSAPNEIAEELDDMIFSMEL